MFDVSSEIVCFVIAKAREFHAKEEVVIPEEPMQSSDDWALQILADHQDDMTYAEVKAGIEDLEPIQQVNLVALMWVGRGDYDASDWEASLDAARGAWTPHTAEYLLATPLVADYLEEGLAQFGFSCQE